LSRDAGYSYCDPGATVRDLSRTVDSDPTTSPVSVVSVDDAELTEYARIVGKLSIHDALIVASHRARETDAIVTSDGVIADAGYETVWK
jgi:hypothetical protein